MKTVSSKLVPLSIALCLIAAAAAPPARAQTVGDETVHAVLDQGRLGLSWEATDGKLQEALTPTGIWQTVTTAASPSGHVPTLGRSRVVDPRGSIVCDTGAREGMVVWATDIMIEVWPR